MPPRRLAGLAGRSLARCKPVALVEQRHAAIWRCGSILLSARALTTTLKKDAGLALSKAVALVESRHASSRQCSNMVSSPRALAAALKTGERRALSKAITLVESRHASSRAAADALLSEVLPHRATASTLRIGISGPPGTGKSTLIESLGLELADRGHRIAVLAVDPSSQRSGGSILGDTYYICMYVKIRRHQHTRIHAHIGPRRHARAPACRRHHIPRRAHIVCTSQ